MRNSTLHECNKYQTVIFPRKKIQFLEINSPESLRASEKKKFYSKKEKERKGKQQPNSHNQNVCSKHIAIDFHNVTVEYFREQTNDTKRPGHKNPKSQACCVRLCGESVKI